MTQTQGRWSERSTPLTDYQDDVPETHDAIGMPGEHSMGYSGVLLWFGIGVLAVGCVAVAALVSAGLVS